MSYRKTKNKNKAYSKYYNTIGLKAFYLNIYK